MQNLLSVIVLVVSLCAQPLTHTESKPAEISRVTLPLVLPELPESLPVVTEATLTQDLIRIYGIGDERAERFSVWILAASDGTGVPPELLASLIMTESSFREKVRSRVGAIGPGQVRPLFWSDYCAHLGKLTDPGANIACAAEILVHYRIRCEGDWFCALAHYNVGPTAYARSARGRQAADRYVGKISRYLNQHTLEIASL